MVIEYVSINGPGRARPYLQRFPQSHSLPQRPRDATVCRLRNDPPLRGQWPPRAGSLALRRPCGRLGLGRRPLSCSQATVRAGATGATKDRGQKNNGLTPVVSWPLRSPLRQDYPVHVRSQAQCLSQAIRSRNEANRLLIIRTRLPVPANPRSTCLTRSSPFASSIGTRTGQTRCLQTRARTAFESCLRGNCPNRPNRQGKLS